MIQSMFFSLGSFFIHPLFYVGLFALAVLGTKRVARERESFHTRVHGKRAEFVLTFMPSLLAGVAVSILTIALGVTLSLPLLIGFALLSLLLFGGRTLQLQTPVYIMTLLLGLFAGLSFFTVPDVFTAQLSEESWIPSLFLLQALLMGAQSMLIRNNGATLSSPQLTYSKRGRLIGMHRMRRLWLLPVVVFIPEGLLPGFVFSFGDVTVQPVLVPFLLGFQKDVHVSLPKTVIRREAVPYVVSACLSLFVAIMLQVFFSLLLSLIGAALIVMIYVGLSIYINRKEKKRPPLFTEEEKSVRIVGILPHSPAAKMKLEIGEQIVSVNGQTVFDECSLYEALQKNPVYCKLTVRDQDGELRLVQGALYDGEHHQIGVLLVQQEEERIDSVV